MNHEEDVLAVARRDPFAKTVGIKGDLVFPSQLGSIMRIAREKRVDADEVCRHELGCLTQDLSFTAAEAFITFLSKMETNTNEAKAAESGRARTMR